jgi:hypothetical protein
MTDDPSPDPPASAAPAVAAPETAAQPAAGPEPDRRPRPFIERIGLALIALVFAAVFLLVAVASFMGGEPFLGVIGVIGCLMVIWVGGLTLFRG